MCLYSSMKILFNFWSRRHSWGDTVRGAFDGLGEKYGDNRAIKEDLLLKNEVLEREREREDASVVAIATITVTWV